MRVRVRYAPSPTGCQHIGGARTALFNYLFARSQNGVFILRIEDTDRERYREDALQDIYETYDWLGFHWDEGPDVGGDHGPYLQSERKELYSRHAEKLIEEGRAYRCYCSSERLAELREEQRKARKNIGYDRHCRKLEPEESEKLRREGRPWVVRLKVPLEGATTFEDGLLGEIEKANRDVSPDPVLLKTDGFPTYHLANVVDDHLMEITHILRAHEWLSSVPIHVLLYRAFGWEPPLYYHLPMVLGDDGKKLSKRHGAQTVQEFRKAGYLPEAVNNYIALLGWSYDDSREFFSLKELASSFTLEKINKAPAVFDYKKLLWFNGQYMKRMPDARLRDLILPLLMEADLVRNPPAPEQEKILSAVFPLVKERLKLLSDAPRMLGFFFEEPPEYQADLLVPKKLDHRRTAEILEAMGPLLAEFPGKSDEQNETAFRELAARLDLKLGSVLMPLRVSLSGSPVSPPLFESMRILGSEKTEKRVHRALRSLERRAKPEEQENG